MAYRVGIYCLLLGQKYRRRVRQVVLYVGEPKMRMEDRLNLGDTRVAYRRVSSLVGPERSRVLAQLGILSGLRGLSGRFDNGVAEHGNHCRHSQERVSAGGS